MDKLYYKDFVWSQNPEVYRQSYSREPVYIKNDMDVVVFDGMGPLHRTITGSGSFFGATAYTDFQSLAALCGSEEPGALVHPIWGRALVYLTELEMTQDSRENHVAYRFTFREADENGVIPK